MTPNIMGYRNFSQILDKNLKSQSFLKIFYFYFREGSACHSYQVDKNGKQWPIPHRRIEWTEEEYFVRNRQVRERCFEVCNALKLALKLNEEPENVKYFLGNVKVFYFLDQFSFRLKLLLKITYDKRVFV